MQVHDCISLAYVCVYDLFDFLGTNASGYYYGHQIKQLLPSLSIIGGVCFTVFIPEIERKYKKIKHVNIISVLVIIAFFFKANTKKNM